MNWYLLTALVVAILSTARTARLIIFDAYPPAEWLRSKWDRKFPEGTPWHELMHCAFCAAPYLAVGMVAWTYAVVPGGDPWDTWSATWWWFLVNGTWGFCYVASIVVAYDQPAD